MTSHKKKAVPYRRKREGRTDYKQRLKLLLGKKPRFAVRKSNARMMVQLITYQPDGDKVEFTVDSTELTKKHGWPYAVTNLPASYLLGMIAAQKAKQKNIHEAVLDLGMQQSIKGGKIYAVLKGAIDGGLKIPANPEIFPSQDRLLGKHMVDYMSKKSSKDYASLQETIEKIKTSVLTK